MAIENTQTSRDADASVSAPDIFLMDEGREPRGIAAEGGCSGSCYSDYGMIRR